VGNAPAEDRAFGIFVVEMERIEVAGNLAEFLDVLGGHRTLVAGRLADAQILDVMADDLYGAAHGRSLGNSFSYRARPAPARWRGFTSEARASSRGRRRPLATKFLDRAGALFELGAMDAAGDEERVPAHSIGAEDVRSDPVTDDEGPACRALLPRVRELPSRKTGVCGLP